MKQNIKKGAYEIDNSCSQYLRQLIVDILQFAPEKRPTIAHIQSHPWIKISQNFNENAEVERLKKHNYQKSMDNFIDKKSICDFDNDKTLKVTEKIKSLKK